MDDHVTHIFWQQIIFGQENSSLAQGTNAWTFKSMSTPIYVLVTFSK